MGLCWNSIVTHCTRRSQHAILTLIVFALLTLDYNLQLAARTWFSWLPLSWKQTEEEFNRRWTKYRTPTIFRLYGNFMGKFLMCLRALKDFRVTTRHFLGKGSLCLWWQLGWAKISSSPHHLKILPSTNLKKPSNFEMRMRAAFWFFM